MAIIKVEGIKCIVTAEQLEQLESMDVIYTFVSTKIDHCKHIKGNVEMELCKYQLNNGACNCMNTFGRVPKRGR